MKKPNLEAMIEYESVQQIKVVYRRNSCYRYILDQIENLPPKSLLAGSELHSMVNYGLHEPNYSILAHGVYLNLKEKYNFIYKEYSAGWYIIEILKSILMSYLEEGNSYDPNLPR